MSHTYKPIHANVCSAGVKAGWWIASALCGSARSLDMDPLDTIQFFELPSAIFVPSRLFPSQKPGLFGISQALLVELNYDRFNAACLARFQFDVMSATIFVSDQLTFD
jgi:hypothetical protein